MFDVRERARSLRERVNTIIERRKRACCDACARGDTCDSELEERIKKLVGNLCVRVGTGSGGGFSACSGASEMVQARGTERSVKALENRAGKETDLCKVSPELCQDNLGLKREEMPQLKGEETKRFVKKLQREGVKVSRANRKVGALKPTQKDLFVDKVIGVARMALDGKLRKDKPIIVSEDDYILDGHHRWAALRVLDPANTIPVYRVKLPIAEILRRANRFDGTTRQKLEERV